MPRMCVCVHSSGWSAIEITMIFMCFWTDRSQASQPDKTDRRICLTFFGCASACVCVCVCVLLNQFVVVAVAAADLQWSFVPKQRAQSASDQHQHQLQHLSFTDFASLEIFWRSCCRRALDYRTGQCQCQRFCWSGKFQTRLKQLHTRWGFPTPPLLSLSRPLSWFFRANKLKLLIDVRFGDYTGLTL